ncbi:MAG TPA: hypothetical protein VFC00_24790 [Micromonosporaceae bacterium]|nr:hypothetical protein [Micromonosporaceae bacterium]
MNSNEAAPINVANESAQRRHQAADRSQEHQPRDPPVTGLDQVADQQ